MINESFGEILKNLNLKNFTVYCPNEEKYIQFQSHFIKEFGNSNIKALKSNILLDDIEDEEKAFEIIEKEHLRLNHRGIDENFKELKDKIYIPKLKQLITRFINNCEICQSAKHDRHEEKIKFEKTEIPNKTKIETVKLLLKL
uniref:Retrovirus-related Pol polyprotein from transposon gypsy n=1 Tax=Ceratitis capitata TaxID=7213 RepID=W8B6F8_CERCA